MKQILIYFALFLFFYGCNKPQNKKIEVIKEKTMKTNLKNDMVIAHRGSTYWTPEETEIAYRWARNIGADYLELDLQLTKDKELVAFHDNEMLRTTNVKDVFPNRKPVISNFTLKELRTLDAGSWFNIENPKRAKSYFKGLKVMTLQDVIMIAEGYRIKKIDGYGTLRAGNFIYEKDPKDNGNRPGLYIETKHPKNNVEQILAEELSKYGWNINKKTKQIDTENGKVAIANSDNRIILQSFSPESILNLEKELPNIPKCFLLWKADFKEDVEISYTKAIEFANKNNVQIIGSSISGEPNNYDELTDVWMTDLVHNNKLLIHAYSFDTNEQLNKYNKRIDGFFTNRADLALSFYNRKHKKAQDILKELEY